MSNDLIGMIEKALEPLHTEIKEVRNDIKKLSEKIDSQHLENLKADEMLLKEIDSIKSDVVYVNRKVADTELGLNRIERDLKQ